MKEKKTPMQWVIRILIVLVFVVAVVLSANRLMEWNKAKNELEGLREQQSAQSTDTE